MLLLADLTTPTDEPRAIALYRSALAVDGSNVIALNNLAYLLAKDNPDEAVKFAQQAMELVPDNPDVQDTLGWVYYRKGMYKIAIHHLKTAFEKQPTPVRQFHLGMTYLKLADSARGRQLVQSAVRQEPNLLKTERAW